VKKIFGIVQVHLDFFEDHLGVLSSRLRNRISAAAQGRRDVKGDGEVLIKNFFALKQICSLEVKASSMPPTESISRAMASAERRSVPLKTMVFHEVGEAVFLRELRGGSRCGPHADGTERTWAWSR